MDKKGTWFPIKISWYTSLSFYGNEELGAFLRGIVQYRYTGQKATVPDSIQRIYDDACDEIDSDIVYAEELSKKRTAAINKRWEKQKDTNCKYKTDTKSIQNECGFVIPYTDTDTDTDTVTYTDNRTMSSGDDRPRRKPKKHASIIYDNLFRWEEFWGAYPKKAAKETTYGIWCSMEPSDALIDRILADIERRKHSHQWTEEGGRYIPNPSTYLNAEKWTEAPAESSAERFARLIKESESEVSTF